jgi:hypothetical protein
MTEKKLKALIKKAGMLAKKADLGDGRLDPEMVRKHNACIAEIDRLWKEVYGLESFQRLLEDTAFEMDSPLGARFIPPEHREEARAYLAKKIRNTRN